MAPNTDDSSCIDLNDKAKRLFWRTVSGLSRLTVLFQTVERKKKKKSTLPFATLLPSVLFGGGGGEGGQVANQYVFDRHDTRDRKEIK